MTIFFRALTILLICCRYRLDKLLPNQLPWIARLFLSFFPDKIQNRGKQLRKACEELGPIYIKFGQLLSIRPDLVPADIVDELNHLQDNVEPFDPSTFRQIVESELGQPVDQLFASFDAQPLASASVAQVHAATLKDDHEVVVKVIRPGIDKLIEKDLCLLLWIAKQLEKWLADGPRLKPVSIVEDYRNTITDELNLQQEAANASLLRRHFLGSPILYVPEIFWDYSNQHVLVMERIYGIPVTNMDDLEAQNTNMKMLAERGVEIFFTQVFEHNFFHADMHPGNIFVSPNNSQQPQYICVDMAIVGSLTNEDQYYLARNLLAMFRRDYRQIAELHVQSGWIPQDTKVNEFEAAIRTVCEPIFEKPISEISLGHILLHLFSTARRFNMEVQPQLVLLQKTLLNIEGLGRQLYPQLDLWQTAHPYLEDWIKKRYHPKNLYKQIKRFAPEWMEKAPHLPMQIFNNLEHLQTLGEMAPTLKKTVDRYQQQNAKKQNLLVKKTVAVLLALSAITLSVPEIYDYIANIHPASLLLGTVALLLWFTAKK